MPHIDDVGLLRFEGTRALLKRERETRAREGPPERATAEDLAVVICCCLGDGDGCRYDRNLAQVVECTIVRELRCCSLRTATEGRPFSYVTLWHRMRSDLVLEILGRIWADVSAATGMDIVAPSGTRRATTDERGATAQALAHSIATGLQQIAEGVVAEVHPPQFVLF